MLKASWHPDRAPRELREPQYILIIRNNKTPTAHVVLLLFVMFPECFCPVPSSTFPALLLPPHAAFHPRRNPPRSSPPTPTLLLGLASGCRGGGGWGSFFLV